MACDLEFEKVLWAEGLTRVAGIDEAGRGPLAGPVVVAAVIFRHDVPVPAGIQDSKRLSREKREDLYAEIIATGGVEYRVEVVMVDVIDQLNILGATHFGMRLALQNLPSGCPDHALVDGLFAKGLPVGQTPVVKGDSLSVSIAAASILAKVTRDRLMHGADKEWPQYGFARHKGYPTPQHFDRLHEYGPCPIHRRSFSPVAQRLLFDPRTGSGSPPHR